MLAQVRSLHSASRSAGGAGCSKMHAEMTWLHSGWGKVPKKKKKAKSQRVLGTELASYQFYHLLLAKARHEPPDSEYIGTGNIASWEGVTSQV